jgi:hypothetical protein
MSDEHPLDLAAVDADEQYIENLTAAEWPYRDDLTAALIAWRADAQHVTEEKEK